MARLPQSVEKLASGNYRCKIYLGTDENGKRITKSVTRPTAKEARLAADVLAAEYKQHKSGNISLEQAMEEYISLKSNILSPSTLHAYQAIAKHHFKDISRFNIMQLTENDIQKAINKESATCSPKTISNMAGFLSAVLKTYRPAFRYNITIPRKTRKLKALPQPAEILKAVHDTSSELPVLLAMWLTLRMSEIRGLRKQDIQGDILTINQVKLNVSGQDIIRQQAKTATSIRRLRVPPYILDLIKQLPEEQEYLITVSAKTVSKRFHKILEANNIPQIAFHDLRHLAASVMLQLNIPDKYAMERGGWSTDSTLKNVYQHTFSQERRNIDNMIDSYFTNEIEKVKNEQ